MKKLSLLFIAMVVALTLSACKTTTTTTTTGNQTGVQSQNYFGSYAGHYETLNYLITQSASDSDLFSNFVDGLVENDNYGNVIPSLAKSWSYEMRDGKQVWTFNIREGVKWVEYDGTEYAEVKAEDWVTSASYILEPANASELTFLMEMFVDGAAEYYSAKADIADANSTIADANAVLADASATAEEKAAAQEDKEAAQEVLDTTVELPFSSVGVKAVDDYTLEYTLTKQAPYFLTVLTYSVFFPVNKDYIEDQGSNFGFDGESILYNGAYILTEDQVDTKVEFTKNAKYWDADNVHIPKVTLIYIPDDAGYDWARLKYENGELTGFRLNELDTAGWSKFVTGDGSGTKENPAAGEAYIAQSISKFTYYMLWNFDRENFDGSNKTDAQKTATEKALLNKNFRLGFLHGVDRSLFLQYYTPDQPDQWARNVYTPRELAQDQNGKDYVDHLADVYAAKNNLSVADAVAALEDGKDSKHNVAKATAAFQQAKTELLAAGLSASDFPIIVETVATDNANILPYYESMVNDFNSKFGEFVQFKLNKPTSNAEWRLWSNTQKSYDLRWMMGWGPDYADPLTYLNTYVVNGDMVYYSNLGAHNVALQEQILGDYTDMVEAADAIVDLDKTDQRYAAFAAAEYKLVYEDAIVIPLLAQTGNSVFVSRTKPYTAMKANYGLSAGKFKYMIVLEEALTRDERNALKAEYEANRP